ncbi:unnamed protein product [Moneuplotes crassus]|uniref:Uncharacterized protein n=1 Tax=Euplotes crassus TaxID=5936 RepID=A0AAD1XBS9_EUPCR|nr:unnamed protein product [Moneuplotes crassus]
METILEVTENASKDKSSFLLKGGDRTSSFSKGCISLRRYTEEKIVHCQLEKENIGIIHSEKKHQPGLKITRESSLLQTQKSGRNLIKNEESDIFLTPRSGCLADMNCITPSLQKRVETPIRKEDVFQSPLFSTIEMESQTGGNSSGQRTDGREYFEAVEEKKIVHQKTPLRERRFGSNERVDSVFPLLPETPEDIKKKTSKRQLRTECKSRLNSLKDNLKNSVKLNLSLDPAKLHRMVRRDIHNSQNSRLLKIKARMKRLKESNSLQQRKSEFSLDSYKEKNEKQDRESSLRPSFCSPNLDFTPKIMKKASKILQEPTNGWESGIHVLTSAQKATDTSSKGKRREPKFKDKLFKNLTRKDENRIKRQKKGDISMQDFLQKSIPIGKLLNYLLCHVKFDPDKVNIIDDLQKMTEE